MVARSLKIYFLVIGLLFPVAASSEGLDFKNPNHQLRIATGFGGSYALSHLYKKQFGLGHETSIIGALLTMSALSVAYDFTQGSRGINGGNTGATAIGGGVAILTFSFFDGSEKDSKHYINYSEMRKDGRTPASDPNTPYPNYFATPPATNSNVNTINVNVNGEKIKTDKVEEAGPKAEKKE